MPKSEKKENEQLGLVKEMPIKTPSHVIQYMVRHRNYKSFLVFLKLKQLYISGMIMNDNGKPPYDKIASYMELPVKFIHINIQKLKQCKLINIDHNNNFNMASYKIFANMIIQAPFKIKEIKN